MILYAISDRRKSPGGVVEWARDLLEAGIDILQIREKDLPDRELLRLTKTVLELPNPHGARVLVNSRSDVALAAGADGVHLSSSAIAPSVIRRVAPSGFTIGVSCHTVAEVRRAEEEGVDFAVFGPVFEPLSKTGHSAPPGPDALRDACGAASIPVLALGGITAENAAECIACGAAGVAAISLFLRGRIPVEEAITRLKQRP